MKLSDLLLSLYSEDNRRRFLVAAAALIAIIAFLDWMTPPIGLGALDFFPILLTAGRTDQWMYPLYLRVNVS